MVYVVLEPVEARGVYLSWDECSRAVLGVPGARYRRASSLEQALALLSGGIKLPPGTHAFVDGNHHGGVAAVLVHCSHNGPVREKRLSAHTRHFLPDAPTGPGTNVTAEIIAVALALKAIRKPCRLTVWHDYEGTPHLIAGRWKARNPHLAEAVRLVRSLLRASGCRVEFSHVRSHQAALCDEIAAWNRVADELAATAARTAEHETEVQL